MNIVWQNKLDNIYDVMMVTDNDDYKGNLIIKKGDVELLKELTTISYGARFGPDVSDVAVWENRCIDFIDKL